MTVRALRLLTFVLLCASCGIGLAGGNTVPPLILGISPAAARAGEVLDVQGIGFSRTIEVFFVSGLTVKPAKFTIVSDKRLEVIFPEFYRGTGVASMILTGANGATVAMPDTMEIVQGNSRRSGSHFVQVLNGSSTSLSSCVAVIEEGALVTGCTSSAVCLVKNRGGLEHFDGSLVIHETGSIFGTHFHGKLNSPLLIRVPRITISPHIEPVLIRVQVPPKPFATVPPLLTGVTPLRARPGDIIVLEGKNLYSASHVYCLGGPGGLVEAGFRAVSDTVLRVEVPQTEQGVQFLAVENPAGIVVSLSETRFPSPSRPNVLLPTITHVHAGQFMDSHGGGEIVIVDEGGVVGKIHGGGSIVLVQRGGRLGTYSGHFLLHETGAILPPETNPVSDVRLLPSPIKEVNRIVFSPRLLRLDIVYHL